MNPSYMIDLYWNYFTLANYLTVFQPNSCENTIISTPNFQRPRQDLENKFPQQLQLKTERKRPQSQRKAMSRKKNIKKTKQDKNFSYRSQEKDRNIYSNILKGFMIRIREDKQYQSKCQQLIRKLNYQFKFDDLVKYIDQHFERTKTYISPTHMKKKLKAEGPIQIIKFFRVLLSKYLKEDFILVLLGSQRIHKVSKILQMGKAKQLWQQLYGEDLI